MSGPHCPHCGSECGDDHRAPHTLPQTWHWDDDRIVAWATGACPYCRLAQQEADH